MIKNIFKLHSIFLSTILIIGSVPLYAKEQMGHFPWTPQFNKLRAAIGGGGPSVALDVLPVNWKISWFLPIDKRYPHYNYFDINLLYHATFGHRMILDSHWFGQPCFIGVYVGYQRQSLFYREHNLSDLKNLQLWMGGIEFGRAHAGQMTLHVYGIGLDPIHKVFYQNRNPVSVSVVDEIGVSLKLSYPMSSHWQVSPWGAYTHIWKREGISFNKDRVLNIGLDIRYAWSASWSVSARYVLIDQYKQGTLQMRVRYGMDDNNLSRDNFQGRVGRLPDTYTPLYLTCQIPHTQTATQVFADLAGVEMREIENSSQQELKRLYHSMALQYHPDKNQDPDASAKMQALNHAYGELKAV